METPRPSRTRRVLALIAIVLNAAFGYFYPHLPLGLEDMKTASDHYPNLFTPASYAFSIWGLIYLSWLLYVIYALLPGQRRNALHDRLCGPLILINLLAAVWIVEFTGGFLGTSQLIIGAMALAGALVFMRAYRGTRSVRFRIPFSLFLGWITVANLANLAALLSSVGWEGGSLGEPAFTMLLLAAAALLGLFVGFRFRDFTYPLVIAWSAAAIGVKQRGVTPSVAFAAFAVAVLMLGWSVLNGARSLRPARAA
jgi:benzodiazapine receptor